MTFAVFGIGLNIDKKLNVLWLWIPCVLDELDLGDGAVPVPVQAPPHVSHTGRPHLLLLPHPRKLENALHNVLLS